MASIKRHRDGWRARINRSGVTKSKVFTTKGRAETWARKIEQQIDSGEYVDRSASEMLLSVALDKYVETVSVNKKGKGYNENKKQARYICTHSIARLPLARIRAADVAAYRDARMKTVSANTVRLELALISHLFTIAIEAWDMDYLNNPVKKHSRPSIKNTARDRRLVGDEEPRLLASAQAYNQRTHALIVVAIETAMRRGELANLRWKDIKSNIATLTDTKNGETRRVPLSSRALEAIRTLPRQLHDDRVFGLHPDAISTAMERVCKRAKSLDGKKDKPIADLRFHDLRHEATSRLFEKGLNPMQVAAITGHKTLQMLKRYTHLRAEDLAKMLG